MAGARRVLERTVMVGGAPEAVFPLLCPVREYEWIEPWQCELVYTASGVAELDCVFTTAFAEDGPPETWVVSRYEPPAVIEFVRVNALRSIRYTITLPADAGGGTRMVWRQVQTGLNEEGDALVRGVSEAAFGEHMALLGRMLDHFLSTGRALPWGGGAGDRGD